MKKTIIIICLIMFASSITLAGEDTKLKSHKTARILSLLPINSPTLFYVKRPARGVVYSFLEGAGLLMLTGGTIGAIQGKNNSHEISDGEARLIGEIVAGAGFLIWFSPWLHTVIKTSKYVEECNEKIRTINVSFAPLIKSQKDQTFYGANFSVNF